MVALPNTFHEHRTHPKVALTVPRLTDPWTCPMVARIPPMTTHQWPHIHMHSGTTTVWPHAHGTPLLQNNRKDEDGHAKKKDQSLLFSQVNSNNTTRMKIPTRETADEGKVWELRKRLGGTFDGIRVLMMKGHL